MFNILSNLATPYLLYIKIGAIVLILVAIIGAGLYVKSVFAERTTLLSDKARLETELTVEKLKYQAMLGQYEQISAMNKNIIEAVKRVKINSNVYIDKVEATPLPAPAAGGTVFIRGGSALGGMSEALPPFAGLPVVNYPFTERAAASSP